MKKLLTITFALLTLIICCSCGLDKKKKIQDNDITAGQIGDIQPAVNEMEGVVCGRNYEDVVSADFVKNIFNADEDMLAGSFVKSCMTKEKLYWHYVSVKADAEFRLSNNEYTGFEALLKDKGFYISTVPLQMCDCGQQGHPILVFAFDKDKNHTFNLLIQKINGEVWVCFNDFFVQAFREPFINNPDKKYAVLLNGTFALVDDENKLYLPSIETRYDWTIDGDVYSVLSKYALSYNDISKEENLIWIDEKEYTD